MVALFLKETLGLSSTFLFWFCVAIAIIELGCVIMILIKAIKVNNKKASEIVNNVVDNSNINGIAKTVIDWFIAILSSENNNDNNGEKK